MPGIASKGYGNSVENGRQALRRVDRVPERSDRMWDCVRCEIKVNHCGGLLSLQDDARRHPLCTLSVQIIQQDAEVGPLSELIAFRRPPFQVENTIVFRLHLPRQS